jgi:cell division septation protein DedD
MSVDRIHQHHVGERRPRLSHPPRRHRRRVWIVVGLFLGFVGLAWAWAFQRGPSHAGSDVPVLAAGNQPTREKPADPGGLKVADIDPLAYDSGRAPPKVENILPAPETPLPQPKPDPKPVAAAPPAPPAAAAPAKAVQTAAIAANAAAAAPAQPAAAMVAAATPSATPAAAETRPPAPAAKPPLRLKAAAFHEEAKPPREKDAAKSFETGADGYRVQLASLHSSTDAHMAEAKLRRSYGAVLSGIGVSIVPVDLGGRGTYYRIMAGPMKQGAASHLCAALRQRGAACLLARH